ncbi:MAG: twin-arginine translocation pathway signal protein [Burkholderiales bacterium]|nr:twin-arginine translocation pathway signal protein [Burkholderiales bacterium]
MERRKFIRLVGGGTVAAATLGAASLAGCTPAMPPEAIEAWNGPGAALASGDVRQWILSYAILAPHSHNLQSWIVDLRTPGEMVLYCDLTRLLPQTDPYSRQIMMSHGTFLELLDMAARERGLRADITLFPQGSFGDEKLDKRPVAHIRLVPDASVVRDGLFAQVLRRHTNRSLYDGGRAIPAAAWSRIMASTGNAGVRMGYVGLDNAAALATHRRIALDAWRMELTTPRTVMESYDVLRVGAAEVAQHRDGLTLLDPVPVALARLGLFDRSKAPAPDDYASTSQIRAFEKKMASTPGFLWMVTDANDRVSQVNAGRTYARVQLEATAQGLAMQPLQQALQEYPEQNALRAEIHALLDATRPGQTVQMWARVGYAPAVPPAPRRRLQDFLRS